LHAVLLLTSLLVGVEVAGGLLSGSLALMADAGHLLTDAAGLALALLALHYSERPATPERTYGYYRVEILAALINSVVLTGVSVFILFEAWERMRNPPPVQAGLMIAVASGALLVNLAGALILRRAAGESLNMRAAYYEVLSDALASLGVIVAAVIVKTTGWLYADPVISALIGLTILPRTWGLLREAVGVLLEGTPSDVNLASLREAIGRVPGVAGVHDLHVWTLTSGVHAMSVHAVLGSAAQHQAVLAEVKDCVAHGFKIAHVTVQIESQGCHESETHL
jgi:cobalt-zinc-cadmium efflux system protein